MRAPRRVLIAEDDPTGHHLYYVRLLADAALARGDDVRLGLSPSVLASPEHPIHLGGAPVATTLHSDFSAPGLAALARQERADLTVVPDGDALGMELGWRPWRGGASLTLLVMRDPSGASQAVAGHVRPVLKEVLLRRAGSRHGVRVLRLRPATSQDDSSSVARSSVARDPVTLVASSADAVRLRREWGLREDVYWFAVIGQISARKNPLLIARALRRAGHPGAGLLLAGKVTADARDDVAAARGVLDGDDLPLVLVDRDLTSVELDAAVRAADCVVVAHSNEGPSGLVGKALAAGTRVCGAGASSLRQAAAAYPDAAAWAPLEEPALASELARAMARPRPAAALSDGAAHFTDALLA